jgi:SAM-dependent methyltransferase
VGTDSTYFRNTCRLCGSKALEKAVELTPTPPGNNFLRKDRLDDPEPVYPIEAWFCGDCHHLQLGHVVDPEILYRDDYAYVSGTSPVFQKHLSDYAAQTVGRYGLKPGSLVADIGSNDGTCLRFFKEAGMEVRGIDPATDIAKKATESGIPTLDEFFGEDLAHRLREDYGPARLITSHNALAHIDDLAGVARGVRHWLADDGLFVFEVGYLVDVYENVWFDTIYHEHLDFHSVEPFIGFFNRCDMEVIEVQRVAPQGGSIRVTAQKRGGGRAPNHTVEELVALERKLGFDKVETFIAYNDRINAVKRELSWIMRGLKWEGKSIAAYGAPTKSTTLLHHFELGEGILDYIVDDNPLKQGLYSPGFHIPVVAASELETNPPDYLLILAWNFAESIMEKQAAFAARGGRFILPMPKARIVE